MAKYVQSDVELKQHLRDQIEFLNRSSDAYDEGFEGEAKRLATTIRVLAHDTKKSKSLLFLLKIKGLLRMLDTSPPLIPYNLAPHQGLVVMKIETPPGKPASLTFSPFNVASNHQASPSRDDDAKVTNVPRVSAPPAGIEGVWVSFNEWWSAIVIKDNSGNIFTRRDLVLALANKDGGAHVDPKLDEPYAKLSRYNSMAWRLESGGVQHLLENSVVAPSMRQIAHEMVVSLEQTISTSLKK